MSLSPRLCPSCREVRGGRLCVSELLTVFYAKRLSAGNLVRRPQNNPSGAIECGEVRRSVSLRSLAGSVTRSLAGNLVRRPWNNLSGATDRGDFERSVRFRSLAGSVARPRQARRQYIPRRWQVAKVAQTFLVLSSNSPRAGNFGSRR